MKIRLSDHFTYGKLLRFTLPSIVMMIFTSIYGVVDGIFVSNFAGKTPFAAVNLIMPYLMAFGVLGFMVGTGGTALISKNLGMGNRQKANEIFSMLTVVCIVGGIVLTVPGMVFLRPNKSLLQFCKFRFDGRALLQTCTNGSSELMSNLSMNLVSMLYNLQLMQYAGEDGIAAYGVIMYVNFMFMSVYIGFSVGSAPIIGFNYGADNRTELKNIFKKSMVLIGIFSLLMTGSAVLLARPLSGIFVNYDAVLLEMTVRGFILYSLSFLLCGFNVFGSSMFTALNNGLVSAVISIVRTLVCQIAAVMLLPLILKLDGIWLSIVVAELAALALTVFCLVKYRKRYHY